MARFDHDKATEIKITRFLETHSLDEKYPIRELSRWHSILCRSCPAGKKTFAQQHNLDVENGMMTIREFIEITGHDEEYGSKVIKKLAEMAGKVEYKPQKRTIWKISKK